MSFWGITAFFNPTHSKKRVENLRQFAAGVRGQGLKLMIVELTFGGQEARAEDCDKLVSLTGGALCWQKERLLNIGLDNLPLDCDRVAWLDGDILFQNEFWAVEAWEALNHYSLLQLFERVVSDGEPSMGMVAHKHVTRGQRFIGGQALADACFGRSGYAWAARREVLDRCGFYDRCIVGGGDAVLGYAAYNRMWPTLAQAREIFSPWQFLDIAMWLEQFHKAVQGNVGFIPGTILHLDHGSQAGRAYGTRTEILKAHEFRPSDVLASESGPWIWGSQKYEMHAAIEQYFERRAD